MPAEPLHLVAQGKVILVKAGQSVVRRLYACILFFFFPLAKETAQVIFQDGSEVMMGVKFVLVGYAGEIQGHQSSPFSTATTRIYGTSSVSREFSIQLQ